MPWSSILGKEPSKPNACQRGASLDGKRRGDFRDTIRPWETDVSTIYNDSIERVRMRGCRRKIDGHLERELQRQFFKEGFYDVNVEMAFDWHSLGTQPAASSKNAQDPPTNCCCVFPTTRTRALTSGGDGTLSYDAYQERDIHTPTHLAVGAIGPFACINRVLQGRGRGVQSSHEG